MCAGIGQDVVLSISSGWCDVGGGWNAVHRDETVSVDDAKPSTLSPSEMKTDPKLKTWCAGEGGYNRTRSGRVPEQV